MTRFPLWLTTALTALAFATTATMAQDDRDRDPYIFAWPFVEADMSPRGGTTKGPQVEVVTETTETTETFERLQAEGLSKLERDRRAILAMAGTYRVSFDFIEPLGRACPICSYLDSSRLKARLPA